MTTDIVILLGIIFIVGLIVYGFIQIFQREKESENDIQVIQRQIRGFACILLSQILLVCLGYIYLEKENITDILRI